MRIILLSDTHGLHRSIIPKLPKGDVLIHAGDCCNIGSERDIQSFVHWFQNLEGYDAKIFIAGNHDWGFERKEPWLYHYINEENLSQSDCVYLEDSSFTIEDPKFSRPIKFYGTPWQPPFMNWAFNIAEKDLYKYYEKIPIDTDVLITHCPPQNIRDFGLPTYMPLGSSTLRDYVEKIKPTLHVFGHIHEAYGELATIDTLFVNGSTCTRRYVPSNKPIIIKLTEVKGKLKAKILQK
jgi:Icc-related predicted phosphoesterase